MIRFGLFLLALFYFSSSYAAEDAPRPMTAIEFIEIERLSAPALSSEGGTLLYLRSETDWANNKTVRRLNTLNLESGESRPAFDAVDEEETHARGIWAPDNSGFLTVLKRDGDDHKQAYFFSRETGQLTRLTNHGENVGNLQWAPDSGAFYFTSSRARDDEERKLFKKKWLIKEYETRRPYDVWKFDRETGEAKPALSSGDFYVRGYALSRDGSKILHMRAPGGLGDDRHDGELWMLDLATGEARQLTDNRYAESRAQLSPDNGSFAFIATVNEKGEPYYEDNLFVQRVGENEAKLLMPDEPIEVLEFSWNSDGSGLFFLGNIGLRTELFYYDLEAGAVQRMTSGDHVIDDWSYNPDTNTHTAIIKTAQNPGEVYVMRDIERGFVQVSSQYDHWSDRFRLPRQEAVSWRGRGRTTIEGLLVYPIDYDGETSFPLVTITHGGPRSSSQFGSWNISRYIPVLAAQGYGVFLPNHRGGTGYGDRFMRDMVGGYFTNAHHDVLDGVEALIHRGLADPEQLVKMGWSAGGHMTNKIITVTDRFKAASSGAGAADWVSMYGESDVRHNRGPWFGGAPWQKNAPIKNYRKHSVIQDAWNVTTPTLFFAGENDERVPPTQPILMYRGIKAAGVETQLYLAPGEPHNFRKPSHRLFKINTELEWFAHHLGREPYEKILPDAAYE